MSKPNDIDRGAPRALVELLRDAWWQELDNGQSVCAGCSRDVTKKNGPGQCGSAPVDCSVVRACIALGFDVAAPCEDPCEVRRLAYLNRKKDHPVVHGGFTDQAGLPPSTDGEFHGEPK